MKRTLAEIAKLQAETEMTRTVETERIKAETEKMRAARASYAMSALDRFSSAFLKLSVGASMLLGSIAVYSRPSDNSAMEKKIEVKKISKSDNTKALGEFLKSARARSRCGSEK